MDVALVDLDFAELDAFRAVLAERLGDARHARVRLVLAASADAPAFAWAGLAGVPRAGETGRLGEVVVDAVVVSARSPRLDATSRLAAALGARPVVLPAAGARAHGVQP